MNDGNIRIGIKITDVDSKIKTVEGKIESLTNKLSNLGGKKLPLQRQLDEINKRMLDNEQEYMNFQNMIKDGQLSASEFKSLGGSEGIERNLLSLESANDRLAVKAQALEQKIADIETKEKDINIQLDDQNRKRDELIQKSQQQQIAQAGQSVQLDGIGKKISSITTKVVKWGLAIFSVRSMYMLVRRAVSTLSQYNEQMATDIQYIQYVLAQMLKPIIEWIINAVYKILTYINYIANAWFGINLFKDAGSKQFAKDMASASDSAKEIKKELAGFDVANVMSEQSSGSKNKGGAGVPSLDLSKVRQIDIPDWVKWIADHKDLIIQLATIVGIAWGASKVANILGGIGKVMTGLSSVGVVMSTLAVTLGVMYKSVKDTANESEQISIAGQKANIAWKKSLDPAQDLDKLINTMHVNQRGTAEQLGYAEWWMSKLTGTSKQYVENVKRGVTASSATLDKLKEMFRYEGRTREEKEKILNALWDQYNYNQWIIEELKQEGQDTAELEKIQEAYTKEIQNANKELGYGEQSLSKLKGVFNDVNDKIQMANGNLDKLIKRDIKDKSFTIAGTMKISEGNMNKLLDKALAIYASITPQFLRDGGFNPIASMIKQFRAKYQLAGGGLVMPVPGHGVPVGVNAVMSERKAEAVIPFENPEAMRKIGKEIGQWVNLAIENKMVVDGRVLATATNNRNSKEEFLMNR